MINVTSGAISAAHTTASGPGTAEGLAGTPLSFLIFTGDSFGNPRAFSADQARDDISEGQERSFGVELVPWPEVMDNSAYLSSLSAILNIKGVTTDLLDGSFSAAYRSTVSGTYHMNIDYGGEPISGSPFAVTINAGAVSAQQCTASGTGLTSAQAGNTATFYVNANDEYGNLNANAGSEDFATMFLYQLPDDSPTMTLPTVSAEINHVGGGKYLCSYNATASGTYLLQVQRDSQPVAITFGNSFFTLIVIPGLTNADKCIAEGLGLSGGTAGGTQNFGIVARDQYSNAIPVGGDHFVVQVAMTVGSLEDRYGVGTDPSIGELVLGTVVDNNDGTYQVEYTAILDGTFTLTTKLNGADNIVNSPTEVILNKAQPPSTTSPHCISICT